MTELTPQAPKRSESVPFWRDIRVLGVLAQFAFLIVVILGFSWIALNVTKNMSTLGGSQFLCRDGTSNVRCAFDFLQLESQFAIAESLIPYNPSDSYARAMMVGALNTAKVAFLGIVLATLLGTLVGIARLSSNWLISNIARWYVDIIRNIPLLLQLFLLFFGVILGFPAIKNAIQLFGLPIYLSQRGIDLPGLALMPSFTMWLLFIALGIALAAVAWWWLGRRERRLERSTNRSAWALAVFLAIVIPGWFIATSLIAGNQVLLAPESSGIAGLADIEAAVRTDLGLDNLGDIDAALAAGTLSREQLDAAKVILCIFQGDRTEANIVAELRRANIPYAMNRGSTLRRTIAAYTSGGCDALVGSHKILSPELAGIHEALPSVVIPVRELPVRLSVPRIEGLNFVGGIKLSPNFAAILIGLTIYTGAFIAEIVRAGIQSVPKGQSEAARALGLSESQRLRLVVLPQASRVIIPPLTNQYLNLTKNSSLAIAVGFPDLWSVAFTTLNQSGRIIQVFLLVMGTYLAFSLLISFFLNWYNRRVALVER